MSQTYNDNTKRSKPKENQLGILGYPLKYTQKVATSLPEKLSQLYLVVQGKTQMEHTSHLVNASVEATC